MNGHYMERIHTAIKKLNTTTRGQETDWAYWNLIWTILTAVMPSRALNLLKEELGPTAYNKLHRFLEDNKKRHVPKEPKDIPNFIIEEGELKKQIIITDDMNDEDLIKLSIEKWITIRNGLETHIDIFDGAGTTCALCQRYQNQGCRECPIQKKTSENGCNGTPYPTYRRAYGKDAHFKAACDEIVFLTELFLEQETQEIPF